METDRHQYELRSGSRSRSQTPLVSNRGPIESDIIEHPYDLRSRSRERSHTPGEVTSSGQSGARSITSSVRKTRDQSVETILEKREETIIENQSKKSEHSLPIHTKKERRSERQKAKRQIFANGQRESKDDSSMQKHEHKNVLTHRTVTSDYSSEEGEREDLPNRPNSAYEIYKQAGDWWNVFPKTDYTYSPQSQCRYEIAPGVLAMPNMSRRSIHFDDNNTMSISQEKNSELSQLTGRGESGLGETILSDESKEIAENRSSTFMDESYGSQQPKSHAWSSEEKLKLQYANTHVEQYRCRKEVIFSAPSGWEDSEKRVFTRYRTPLKNLESRKYNIASSIDSDTELDEAVSISGTKIHKASTWKVSLWISSVITTVALWFSKVLEFLKLRTVKRRDYRATYQYQRYQEPQWYRTWRYVDDQLQYVYMLMVKILFFDSWLLSRMSSIRRWVKQRRPATALWLALLPLLLLTGCWCLPQLTESFTFFFTTKMLSVGTRQYRDVKDTRQTETFIEESLTKESVDDRLDLKLLAERLKNRLDKLEEQSLEQTERLLNVSRVLEHRKESDMSVWSKYNNKMMVLEKKLENENSNNANIYEMERLKLEFETLKELYTELKGFCTNHIETSTDEHLEKRIETILSEYFGIAVSKKEITTIIRNLLVVGEAKNSNTPAENGASDNINIITDEHVREIVKEALRIYDADKTARADYALESAGGQIISTRCTQKYGIKTRAYKLLAFTLYHENYNPRTVIQGNPIQPGACWAFQGFPGYLLIRLRSFIYVTGFTLEHAPQSILPNGDMKSAPRKFNVWGFADENDPEPVMFGDYEYVASDDSLQYFPLQNTSISTPYEYIELRIHNNHGQLEYTCLYRFRVHGRPV